MSFEINNDLSKPVWDKHNRFHLIVCGILTACPFLHWWIGIALFTLWELGDGFKPWGQEFKPTGHKFRDWIVKNFLYSNKFSMQDFVIWDMSGFGWGMLIRQIIKEISC